MNESKIRALVAIAYTDGFFDSRELFIINQRAKDLGINQERILEIIRNPEGIEFIQPVTEKEKLEFMFDLMKIIFADEIVVESEKKMFYKYLNKLEFQQETQDIIYNLIFESVIKNQSFESFLIEINNL